MKIRLFRLVSMLVLFTFAVSLVPVTKARGEALDASILQQRIDRLRAVLNEDQLQFMRGKRDQLADIRNHSSENKPLIAEVWTRIHNKIGASADYDELTQDNVLRLLLAGAVLFDVDGTNLDNARKDPTNRAVLDQLLKLGGQAGGINGIDFIDLEQFIAAIEQTAKSSITSMTLSQALKIANGDDGSRELLTQVIDVVLQQPDLKFSAVMRNVGVTADDLAAVMIRFGSLLFPTNADKVTFATIVMKYLGITLTDPSPVVTPPAQPPVMDAAGQIVIGADQLTVTKENGKDVIDLQSVSSALINLIHGATGKDGVRLVLNTPIGSVNSQVRVPGALLAEANASAVPVTIQLNHGTESYAFTVPQLQLAKVAADAGVPISELEIQVNRVQYTDIQTDALEQELSNKGIVLRSTPVQYDLNITKDGQVLPGWPEVGKGYIELNATVEGEGVDPSRLTGAVIDPETGELQFVPATFEMVDGKLVAHMKYPANGTFVIVETGDQTFNDVQGHWSQDNIELLANKLIVNGDPNGTFDPNGDLTRGELVSTLVRSLGYGLFKDDQPDYNDVLTANMYSNPVNTASAMGIIQGDGDGSFRPDDRITREELSVILYRVLGYLGKEQNADQTRDWSDTSAIHGWAAEAIGALANAGILNGYEDDSFRPQSNTTRAEAAAMLVRLLQSAGFMNR